MLAAAAATGAVGMGAGVVGQAGASTKPVTVTAIETDFHIALSQKTFTPGRSTFVTKNKGQSTHALEIVGPGVRDATTPNLSPGQSAKLTVTLKKGTYDVSCPVPGHKQLGMNLSLTVRSGSASGASGSNGSGAGSGGSGSSAGAGGASF